MPDGPKCPTLTLMKRLPKLATVGLVLFAVVASYWLWLAPGGPPGCDDIAACTSSAELELSALGFDIDTLQRRAVALSPDGETVVVVARAEMIDSEPFEAAIASFDVASGAHRRTYLSQELVGIEDVAFSPDGSLLAVSYYREGAERFVNEVRLLEVPSGRSLHSYDIIGCDYSLGLSADNSQLQCQSDIFDVASGERVGGAQDDLATHSLSDNLFTTAGWADIWGDELRLVDHVGNETMSISFGDRGKRIGRHVQVQGTLDGSRVLYLARTEGDPFWKPRPQRIGGWLVVFDVTNDRHAATIELGAAPVGVAVTDSGSDAVVIDEDFRLQSFSVDSIVAQQ